MHGITRSPTDSKSSAHDSMEKRQEKETVDGLAPVVSTRAAQIYEDPNASLQAEDTHEGEFGTKRDLVRCLKFLSSPGVPCGSQSMFTANADHLLSSRKHDMYP